MAKLSVQEVVKAGGKVHLGRQANPLVDSLACKIVGVLADAPDQETRRRALNKALRMLSRR